MDNAISFLRLKGWHPLAAGPVNPGLLPRTGRSGRHRRWVPEKLGPGRQIDLRTARAASADSEVRPGPRPQTLRPYQAKTTEAGPEAQSTSSLPTRRAPLRLASSCAGCAYLPVIEVFAGTALRVSQQLPASARLALRCGVTGGWPCGARLDR